MNLICVICSELLSESSNVHVTTCGHMFHHDCLLQWLERSKTCPECRADCTDKNLSHRIYFHVADLTEDCNDVDWLLKQLDEKTLLVFKLKDQLEQQGTLHYENRVDELIRQMGDLKANHSTATAKLMQQMTKLAEKKTNSDMLKCTLEEKLSELTIEKMQLDNRVRDLSKQLNVKKVECSLALSENSELKQKLIEMEQAARSRIKLLDEISEQSSIEKLHLEKRVQELTQQLKIQSAQNSLTLSDMEQQYTEMKQKLDGGGNQNKSSRKKQSSGNSFLSSSSEQAHLENRVRELTKQLNIQKVEHSMTLSDQAELEQKLVSSQQRERSLKKMLDESTQDSSSEKSQLENRLRELSKQLNMLKVEHTMEISELQCQYAELKQKFTDSEQKVRLLKDQLEENGIRELGHGIQQTL